VRAVNLLPGDEARGRQRPPLPALVACCGTVLVTAIVAVFFLSASSKVGANQETLNSLTAELAATPPPKASAGASNGQLPQERTQRVAALSSALAERIAWDRVLRELAQVLPEDVWLASLAASAPVTAPGASVASTFQVSGFTYSQDGVARLLSRLQILPDLVNVQLISSLSDKIGQRPVVRFTISAAVRAPGATS
jgi:Tfp pilus assembly protein PilN